MRVDIYGAGMAGAYLANLFEKEEIKYDLYEKNLKNKHCPSHCAFGWANYSKVKKLCKYVGIDSEDYVLARPKKAIVNDVEMKIRDVVTFDKTRFIFDLRDRVKVQPSPRVLSPITDLHVDATGHRRAFVGFDDRNITKLKTKQYRLKDVTLDEDYIYIFAKRYGYAWAFPLGDNEWHVGAGGFTMEQVEFLLKNLVWTYGINYIKMKCGCKSPIIWDYGISCWKPYGTGHIVAIGEAGGFVSAFGEGNTLALETAKCLYDAICYYGDFGLEDVVLKYIDLVKKETAWIKPQYDFVKALNKNWFLGLLKVPSVIKVANMRNLDTSVWDGLKLMWKLR